MRIKKRTRPADFGPSPRGAFAEVSPDAEAPFREVDERASEDAPAWSAPEEPRFHSMTATAQRTPARQDTAEDDYEDAEVDPYRPPPGWPIYLTALAVAGLWALGPIAFALGYRQGVAPLRHDSFAILVFSLLAVWPRRLVLLPPLMRLPAPHP